MTSQIFHSGGYPLSRLFQWSPIKIDALGLVTILGADEMNWCIGRLSFNRYTEYLPLLGAYTMASDSFTSNIPGFILYNITDGIQAPDVSGWFCRWLLLQDLCWNKSTLIWTDSTRIKSNIGRELTAMLIGFFTQVPLLVVPILLGDWWGLFNGLSMILSVMVRLYMVNANRVALSRNTYKNGDKSATQVKCLVTLPDGRVASIYAPRHVVVDCFLTKPCPSKPVLYGLAKIVGWVAFGCHVISIGQSSLLVQIYSVGILLLATIIVARKIGCDEQKVGGRLRVLRLDHQKDIDRRSVAYARLQLNKEEERSMIRWSLFPHQRNKEWWAKYRAYQTVEDEKRTLYAERCNQAGRGLEINETV